MSNKLDTYYSNVYNSLEAYYTNVYNKLGTACEYYNIKLIFLFFTLINIFYIYHKNI